MKEGIEGLKWAMHRRAKHCAYCDVKLKRLDRAGPDYPSIEHQIPKVRGGKDEADNLVIVCKRCNSMKMAMTFQEFLEKIMAIYNNLTNSSHE